MADQFVSFMLIKHVFEGVLKFFKEEIDKTGLNSDAVDLPLTVSITSSF